MNTKNATIKLLVLNLLFLAIPNAGQTALLGPAGSRPLENRLEGVRNTCLRADYSKVQCGAYESIHLYNRDILDRLVIDPVFDTFDLFTDALYELRRASRLPFEGPCPSASPCNGRTALRLLQQELNQALASQELRPCQQICLAKCVANHAFDYFSGINGRQSIMNEEFAIELGYGDCKAYSKLFDRLLGSIGYQSTTITKMGRVSEDWTIAGHAFNAVLVEGKWYRMDATTDECAFVDPGQFNAP